MRADCSTRMKSRGRSHGLLNCTSEGFDALYHFADDAVARKGMSIMRYSQPLLAGIAAVGLIMLSGPSAQSQRQKMPVAAAAAANQTQPPPLKCTPAASPDPFLPDPFKFRLAGDFPAGLLPIDDKVKDSIMKSGLPCQENVRPTGQEFLEAEGLENLQRGFDFYSWRTFLALNSPADGKTSVDHAKADMPARWEDMDSFKPLLDVMLPANLQPKWPTDRAGMEAERKRLVPEQCRELHQQFPDRMIVKMIEESFNEPFKTGPLIDQQGHYAIFDILMNRQMFKYITDNHLNTKAGQAENADLAVDFPPGQNGGAEFGSFMLKVSWKILTPEEIAAKTFHMRRALVLMPPGETRPCLDMTLGLIGFHAVHKTAGRPQWIWTSFEHVKNVPDRNEIAANKLSGSYNFFSVKCKPD